MIWHCLKDSQLVKSKTIQDEMALTSLIIRPMSSLYLFLSRSETFSEVSPTVGTRSAESQRWQSRFASSSRTLDMKYAVRTPPAASRKLTATEWVVTISFGGLDLHVVCGCPGLHSPQAALSMVPQCTESIPRGKGILRMYCAVGVTRPGRHRMGKPTDGQENERAP